jgi:hypothetical protein
LAILNSASILGDFEFCKQHTWVPVTIDAKNCEKLTAFWFDSSAWCYSWWFIDANALPPRNYHPYEQGDAWEVK